MRVMCAIGRRGGPSLIDAISALLDRDDPVLLVHVVDSGPRRGLEGFLGGPASHGPRAHVRSEELLDATEAEAAERILAEARSRAERLGVSCEVEVLRGAPEREILRSAAARSPDLLVIGRAEGPPPIDAPRSPGAEPGRLGRVARFVVDHAAWRLLLVPLARDS